MAAALQTPEQLIVPQFADPQSLAVPQQPFPYPAGRAGALTLQAPGDPAGFTTPATDQDDPKRAFTNLSPHQVPKFHIPNSGVPLHWYVPLLHAHALQAEQAVLYQGSS